MTKRTITLGLLAVLLYAGYRRCSDDDASTTTSTPTAHHAKSAAPAPVLLDDESHGIVRGVTADRTTLCAGEDALVTVKLEDGVEDVEVVINEARTSSAILRYSTPGTHRVRVRARGQRDGERVDGVAELELSIAECPDKPQLWAVARSSGSQETAEGMIVLQRGLRGEVRYEWDFGDGTIVRGAKRLSHTYEARGNYIIKVTATDEAGTTIISRAHYTRS